MSDWVGKIKTERGSYVHLSKITSSRMLFSIP